MREPRHDAGGPAPAPGAHLRSGTVYGGRPGEPWACPHATVKAALTEWIQRGTFNGASTGRFLANESGVANPS